MNPDQWQQIKQLFYSALELEVNERAVFLDQVCNADPSLRSELESLLSFHEQGNSFIERPAILAATDLLTDDQNDSVIGSRIGPYMVIREIGQGGMGAVYLAVRADDQYQKQVAIKLIRRGMDTDFIVRRFRNERQILAELDHPSIAKLLDGGATEDGLPYLVMEYIEGLPIDVYCDSKKLSTLERVKLFRTICSAVDYAHQNLVVHRDIKPNNILVTDNGVAKLLDFGIAKLLNPELSSESSERTLTIQRLMTPEYASPEQIRGETITTSSDIYSLGVLLYELLTGHRPHQLRGRPLLEILRVITEENPEKPSTVINRIVEVATYEGNIRITPHTVSATREGQPDKLRRRLRGDLDNILLMAMRKEPNRRYSSVREFSDDIRRHLQGLPVIARRDTAWYRSGKFINRHRIGVAAAVLLLVTLLSGVVATLRQAQVARGQRDLAVKAANSMIHELSDGLKKMVGPTESRLGLLSQAASVFDEITKEGLSTPELERQAADANRILAQTYNALGDVQNALYRAIEAMRQARALEKSKKPTIEDKSILAACLLELGDALASNGKSQEAAAAYEESLTLCEEISQDTNVTPEMRRLFSLGLERKGDRLYYEGKLSEAESIYNRSFEINSRLLAEANQDPIYLSPYATSLERVGDVLYAQGKVDRSCNSYRDALRVRQQANDRMANDPTILRMLAIAMQNVGWCAEQEEKLNEAITLFEESVKLQRQLVKGDPSNTVLVSNLIGGLGTLGNALTSKGNTLSAINLYSEALKFGKSLREQGRSTPRIDANVSAIAQLLSDAFIKKHQFVDASKTLDFSLSLLEKLMAEDPENLDYPRKYADSIISKADLLLAQRRLKEGLPLYKRALEIRKKVSLVSGTSEDKQLEAFSHYLLGQGFKQEGKFSEAHRSFLESKTVLLDLRDREQLSDSSEGFRIYLPKILKALGEKNTFARNER